MTTVAWVLVSVLAGGFVALSSLFWWWVIRNSGEPLRQRVERRFGVTLELGTRGHWRVTSGEPSAFKRFGIELLQIGWFMGAMAAWSVGVSLAVGLMNLAQRL